MIFASRDLRDGTLQTNPSVPRAHCAGCLARVKGILSPQVNLTAKRVAVRWRQRGTVPPLNVSLRRAGYEATLVEHDNRCDDSEMGRLLSAPAVAGRAPVNLVVVGNTLRLSAPVKIPQQTHGVESLTYLVEAA